MNFRQNLGFKGLIGKIFRNKDLAGFFGVPSAAFGCQRALKLGLVGASEARRGRRTQFGTPLIRGYFRNRVVGMSVMAVTGECDEKVMPTGTET
jgi:hypothetical protein